MKWRTQAFEVPFGGTVGPSWVRNADIRPSEAAVRRMFRSPLPDKLRFGLGLRWVYLYYDRMTRQSRKFTSLSALVAAGALATVGLVAPAAQSYPVGTSMTLTASKSTVKAATESITFNVAKAGPSCSVVLSVEGVAAPFESSKTSSSGGAASWTGTFPTAGKFTVKVTRPLCKGVPAEVKTVLVTVYSAPLAPTGVKATSPSKGSVNVTWTKPTSTSAASGYSAITEWSVKVYTAVAGGAPVKQATAKGSGTSAAVVSGLTGGKTYYVSVVATNKAGSSVASSPRVKVVVKK